MLKLSTPIIGLAAAYFLFLTSSVGILCERTGNRAVCELARFHPMASTSRPFSTRFNKPENQNYFVDFEFFENGESKSYEFRYPHFAASRDPHIVKLIELWNLREPRPGSTRLRYLVCYPGTVRNKVGAQNSPDSAVIKVRTTSGKVVTRRKVSCQL